MKVLTSLILCLFFAVTALAGPVVTKVENFTTSTTGGCYSVPAGVQFHVLRWRVVKGTLSAGTVKLAQYTNAACTTGASDIIAATTSTSNGTASITSGQAIYVAITTASFAGGGTLEVWWGGYIDVAAGISSGTGTSGQVAFFDGAATIAGDADLTFTGGNTLLATNLTVSTALTNTALTSGRIPIASTGGLLADDADLTFSGATTTATNLTVTTALTNSALTAGRVPIVSTAGLLADDSALLYNAGTDTLTTSIFAGNLYTTLSNCADSAGDADCGAAGAGSVVIDAADTNTVVSTTIVTANSQVFLQIDASLGTRLSVTCNTQAASVFNPRVTARTAATSFTITVDAGPTTNPLCLSYFIVN